MHLFRVFGVAARARDSKGNKPKKTILLRRERSRARRHDEKEDKTKKKTILLRSFFYTNRHTAHVRLRALEFPHQKAPVQSAMAAFRVAWSWCSKSANGRRPRRNAGLRALEGTHRKALGQSAAAASQKASSVKPKSSNSVVATPSVCRGIASRTAACSRAGSW